MSAQIRRILTYLISFALAGVLMYLAFRGVDFDEFKATLAKASYVWALPLVVFILISHVLRAWRWQILLEALPDYQRMGELRAVSIWTAFWSVMIGYLVNFLVPRLGEVVRAGNLSRQEGLRFSGVLGTVVIERIVDVLVLLLGILSLSFLFSDQFSFLVERILNPSLALASEISAWWMLAGLMGTFAVGYLAFRKISTSQARRLLGIRRRIMSVLNGFKAGILTLLRAPKRAGLIASTMLMWVCYTLMAYFPLVMLAMHTDYDLNMATAWSLMIFGAIGVTIPAPGGTGSYHYITRLVLVNLYAVDEATAIAYAILSHGIHLIVYILVGALAFFVQGTSLHSLSTSTLEVDQ